jgi:protein disulfide-isomerase
MWLKLCVQLWPISRNRSFGVPIIVLWRMPVLDPYRKYLDFLTIMNKRLTSATAVAVFVLVAIVGDAIGQGPAQTPQIYWLQSAQQASQLASQFNTPILVYVTSEHCGYCRKMERETWSNPQIIAMVEGGFIPLELTAERDAEMIEAMGIRAFPTTLLFTPDAQFVRGAPGYLSPIQAAGLMKSIRHPEATAQSAQASP